MNADDFAMLCKTEKNAILSSYFDATSDTAVARMIAAMGLEPKQTADLRTTIDGVLTDAMYTLLVAIDGGASLGGVQQPYDLRDQTGEAISGDGELEAAAFEHFHEH
ncbi:hypothetical protein [Novipirellula aureliae]|nr:hypothetical protein [Novipirellula aureliae]